MSHIAAATDSIGLIQLQKRTGTAGSLVVLESLKDVPFDIRRVYYVYGTPPGASRGYHAHRALRQFAVAVAGSVTMAMDDGHRRWHVPLDRPDRGAMIPPLIWHEMHDFSADCVLLVLASAEYDEQDYIRDREEFERLTR